MKSTSHFLNSLSLTDAMTPKRAINVDVVVDSHSAWGGKREQSFLHIIQIIRSVRTNVQKNIGVRKHHMPSIQITER